MEIEEYISRFRQDNQLRLASKTLKAYVFSVRSFHQTVNKPLKDVSKRDIRHWLHYLSETGYKMITVETKLIGLKAFFKYCYEEGFVEKDLAKEVRFPRSEASIPRYLKKEQLNRLRELVKEQLLGRAVIEVLYATGVRISELIAMKKADINWLEKSILIPKGKWKKARIVLFNHECAIHLQAYLDSRTDDLPYVFINKQFNRPLHPQRVSEKFQTYSETLGFRVHPHLLRHTFAAHLAQKGMPLVGIQSLLGHEDLKTTHIYAQLYDHARKEKYDQWML